MRVTMKICFILKDPFLFPYLKQEAELECKENE
jgi:hypothetical protein